VDRGEAVNGQGDLFDGFDRDPVPCPTCQGSGLVTAEELRRRIEDRPGQVGRKHPETSRRAAKDPRFGTQKYRCLEVLSRGARNAADVARAVGVSPNQTATRLGELREDGFVTYSRDEEGTILEGPTGRGEHSGRVQEITDLGRTALWRAGRRGGGRRDAS